MEVALGAANWLLGQVLSKLSDDLVKAYVSSTELGLNLEEIKGKMLYTRALLDEVQGRDLTNKPSLQGLLKKLGKKADEAEDALDELHYFMLQDKLDGTRDATPDLGGGLCAKAQHGLHAARKTAGNWLSSFTCCLPQNDVAAADAMSIDGDHVGKLPFDRVAMSNKIKQLIDELHFFCIHVSKLLDKIPSSSLQPHMPASNKRSYTSSQITQKDFFGRDAIFEKTIGDIIRATQSSKTLSVLPIVGLGGIGKTTFSQYLYNDQRIKECFPDINVWICVSTNFDVFKLTKEILSCLPVAENQGSNLPNETTNLDLLQKSIEQRLKSKRFLIVLDDIWECSSNEWGKLLAPFGKDETSGNVILVTTRFPKIVEMVTKETNPVDLPGLDPDEFWEFFKLCGRIKDEHVEQEFIDIARQIANKLKCNPLAAQTVGRLLSKKPQEHWMEILENKEWLKQNDEDGIMPALQISYDYLPFHLKKCFSFFALFPEDYKFDKFEIIRFWTSIGIIVPDAQNGKFEDIGSDYLDELLDNGFLRKGDDNYYIMHDLHQELSRRVSFEECAYISCSSFKANKIPQSIRYLSIFMQDIHHIQEFNKEMGKLKEWIDIKNLQSLMIFGEYSRLQLVNILRDTFEEIKGLRVLSIFMNSQNSLPNNFSELVHLRYLKLVSPYYSNVSLPRTVSRFYHLKFLDVNQWGSGYSLPKDICRLENLHHFVAKKEFHSNVPEVGKMILLQELKEFHVKKESFGFELEELGKLEELGGELNICRLENVRTKQEAKEANLMAKRNLVELGLVWYRKQESTGDDIIDSIQPHSNLRRLRIVNHGGAIGPSWLCSNNGICMKNLETLHLESISWANLPPIGQFYHLRKLKLKNIAGLSQIGPDFFGGTTEKSFTNLKEVGFHDMAELVEWVGGANCHLFSRLEKIRCSNCPKLTMLLFSGWPIFSAEDNTIWFSSLCELHISNCPKLCLPPLPHTQNVSRIETDCLSYDRTKLTTRDALFFSFIDLQKLHSLRHIEVGRCEETFLRGLDDGVVLHEVQSLELGQFSLTRKSLSNLFKCFPALSRLNLRASSDEDHEEVVLQFPPSSSLRDVSFNGCKNLTLPVKEEEGTGFWGLSLLESVRIRNCDKLFSRWSMGGAADQTHSIINPLPPCLKELLLWDPQPQSTLPMALFANLTSLTSLILIASNDITVDGFDPRITFNLEHLQVYNQIHDEAGPYSIAEDLFATVVKTKTMPVGSFQLVSLEVDSISAVLVSSICTRLSATLQRLDFNYDRRTENFTKEQDEALQLLTSLQLLWFDNCMALQSLPQGLHRLPSLKVLRIWEAHKIRSLPKEGLPDSLQQLYIAKCGPEIYVECQKLRETRPDIDVNVMGPFIADAESWIPTSACL